MTQATHSRWWTWMPCRLVWLAVAHVLYSQGLVPLGHSACNSSSLVSAKTLLGCVRVELADQGHFFTLLRLAGGSPQSWMISGYDDTQSPCDPRISASE